jgi:hypothetical protein
MVLWTPAGGAIGAIVGRGCIWVERKLLEVEKNEPDGLDGVWRRPYAARRQVGKRLKPEARLKRGFMMVKV